jgi:ribonuclease VapC
LIVVDASAVVAILLAEPEAVNFTLRLKQEKSSRVMSAVNYW